VAEARGVATQLADLVTEVIGGELPVGLRAWDGSRSGPADGPCVVLRSRRALRRLLWDPNELGLARAFVSGDLDVDGDLAEGLRRCWALVRDGTLHRPRPSAAGRWRAVRQAVRLGVLGPRPAPPPEEMRPTGRLHSRARDRSVIAHHYDLGNDFYRLVLDPHLAYSCAYWDATDADQSLADAQRAKLDLICRKLGLRPGMRLLDVGCGWGSLVVHAAERYGVDVTGITLSAQQAEQVRARIAERGLTDRARVRLCDYRDFTADAPFDAVASVEMGEHVGERNYAHYAGMLHRMLRPEGRLLLQQMSRGPVAPGGGAFIEAYITPDMTMAPVGSTLDHLERAGFEIRDVQVLREHYDRTIRAWAETVERNAAELTAVAGPGQVRVWRLYLAGGALAFAENRMGVNQILAVRATADGRSGMPPTPRDWYVADPERVG
jgi:cyclopropane-fatty-acyl-phospholipid synthase